MGATIEQVNQVSKSSNKNTNPTGKGGFRDHPELINARGRPKNQESFTYWMNFFKNLTRVEFLKWLNAHPGRTVAADLAYVRVKKARDNLKEFHEVANRTEGMPSQRTDVTTGGEKIGVSYITPRE